MIIDFHTHAYDKQDYVSRLAETAHNLGIHKLCIGGGDARYGFINNTKLIEQADAYPELLIPFGFFRPELDSVDDVESMNRLGFRGLKIGFFSRDCDQNKFTYAMTAAAELSLPVLMHTRIFPLSRSDRFLNLDSERARPIYLDSLARALPDLKIVGTGLGSPWFEEAAALLSIHHNIYFDLSGVKLSERGPHFFKMLLGTESDNKWDQGESDSSWRHIVFGTAVSAKDMPFVEREYQRLFRALALPDSVEECVMGGNSSRLLRLM